MPRKIKDLSSIINLTRQYCEAIATVNNKFNIEEIGKFENIKLEDIESIDKLPSISTIYFLIHEDYKLLYIGKTGNLKSRWRRMRSDDGTIDTEHKFFSPSLEIKNIKLLWYPLSEPDLSILENILIFNLEPIWNTAGNPRTKAPKKILYPEDEILKIENSLIGKSVVMKVNILSEYEKRFLPSIGSQGKIVDIRPATYSRYEVWVKWDKNHNINKHNATAFPKYEFHQQLQLKDVD